MGGSGWGDETPHCGAERRVAEAAVSASAVSDRRAAWLQVPANLVPLDHVEQIWCRPCRVTSASARRGGGGSGTEPGPRRSSGRSTACRCAAIATAVRVASAVLNIVVVLPPDDAAAHRQATELGPGSRRCRAGLRAPRRWPTDSPRSRRLGGWLVHDAARPFVTRETVDAVSRRKARPGAVRSPGKDAERPVSRAWRDVRRTVARDPPLAPQTPQGFPRELLSRHTHEPQTARRRDAALVERTGGVVASFPFASFQGHTAEDSGCGTACEGGGYSAVPVRRRSSGDRAVGATPTRRASRLSYETVYGGLRTTREALSALARLKGRPERSPPDLVSGRTMARNGWVVF